MTADTTTRTHSEQQAQAQLDSIRELVTRVEHADEGHDIEDCGLAYECERCAATGGDDGSCAYCDGAGWTWKAADYDGLTFDEYHDEDAARERIYEDPLSVETRSDWTTYGEEFEAAEFAILLCTGGPAVRIRGELSSYGEPSRAWLEHQDWGTPWQEYHGDHATDALLAYSLNFLHE